jgi:aspartyl-tRNA(Asn)/glutamyl-tRNA(Gln) amidotransferase subunit A
MIGASNTAVETAAAVRSGNASATEVTRAALDRIETHNPRLNAFTLVTRERVLGEAAALDSRIARGEDPGPLAGVPFAVKNLFDVAGETTLAGAKVSAGMPPAARDAAAIARLNAAGAMLVGALNMGEFAYDFTGRNAHFGPSRNPHDLERISGGSSGGSGSAVAGGLVPLALGTDTNGSIRVPAALCGVFGLKPTYGRLTRRGAYPFAASFDHIGPLARSVADLALSYDAMQGLDPDDPACALRPREPASPHIERGATGLRIAVAGGYFAENADPACLAAVDEVARALGAVRSCSVPEAARARAAAFVITGAEGGNLHLDRVRTQASEYDPETRDRFIAGALTPAAWYVQAQRFRRWFRARMQELFRDVDVIVAPATPAPAPGIHQATMRVGVTELPVRANLGIFTQPFSFVGLPVVAVPVQRAGDMPVGVQLVAAAWNEIAVLRAARALERDGVARAVVPAGFG